MPARDWQLSLEPLHEVDLVEPGLGGGEAAEEPAAGPEFRREAGEGRPLCGLERPAHADHRPQSVLQVKERWLDHEQII